jgi:hypothetical protein
VLLDEFVEVIQDLALTFGEREHAVLQSSASAEVARI